MYLTEMEKTVFLMSFNKFIYLGWKAFNISMFDGHNTDGCIYSDIAT